MKKLKTCNKICALRARLGLSMGNAAEAVGMSRTTWRAIELGYQSPRVVTLSKIAETFGLRPADLIDD